MSTDHETLKGNTLLLAARSIMKHTNAGQKSRIATLSFLVFISAVLDVVGLAAVLPLIKAGSDPDAIHTNKVLYSAYQYLNFQTEHNFILFMIGALFSYFVLKTVFGIFVSWLQARLASDIAVYITRNQFEKYYRLDYLEFSNIKSSVIIRNILNNPFAYVQWIINPLTMIVSEIIIVILIVGAIAYYDLFLLGFMIVTVGPATIFVYQSLRKRGGQKGRAIDSVFPFALSSLTESINGYIDIKLSGKEEQYKGRFLRLLKTYHELQQSLNILSQIPLRTNELIALLGIILIFLYGIFLSSQNTDLIIMVGAFAAAAYRLMPSMNRILNSLMYINNNRPAIHNLDVFEDMAATEGKCEHPLEITFNHTIRFDHVSFRFPGSDSYIFKDLDFEVKKGETVGFIGESGSGKTTLMKLLLRFFREESGQIVIDGVPLRVEHIESWRKHIGYVKQDIFLLDGTIEENITLSDPDFDEARLNHVLRQSSLDKFVESLPDGVDTEIGEKGSNLSGGQRQRISIARSLYRNAEILVFDEATSALDNATENEVTESIDELSRMNKTIFIIAHRITTLRNCDRIYEIKDGCIGGVYSYKELAEKLL